MPDPSGAGLDDEAVTVEVEAGACLLASWGAGQELLVSSVQDPSSRAIASETKTDGADLWVLPRGTLAAAERRVVYDMAPKFAALQRVIHQGSCTEAELTQQLVQYAAEISAILLADSPQVADVEEAGPMDSDSLSAYLELVLPQHLVWKILQIFWALPEVDRGGPVTEQLVQLVRQHAALLLPDARLASISSTIQQMAGTVAPETEPGYWSLLTQLVALGWTREAVQLLGCHSLWSQYQNASSALRQRLQPQFEMIEAVNMLLRNMPRFRLVPAAAQSEPQVGSGQLFDSLPQYQHHRRHWRGMCSDLRQGRLDGMPADCWEACAAVDADTADGLKMVASVMAGDVAAITKVLGEDARGSWLPLAVALLLHLQPDVPLMGGMLSRLIEECRAAVGSCAEAEAQQMQDTLQKLLLAGAENDARAFVLEVTRSGVCRPWTVAHVVHLLSELPASAAALAACPLPHLQCRSEEYYVLDFVSGMMAEPGMWSVALQYLAWCPVHGAAAAHHQLSRLLLAGEPALTAAVLHSCEQHSLPSVANGLRRAVGMANATEGHVAEALRWLLDAGDAAGAVRALRPLLAQTEEALLQPGEGLQLPEGLWQLEDLLQACCRDSATLTQPGCPGGDGGQPLLFLREMLALAESLDLLACGASLPAQDGARQRLRQALLRLIVHRAAPARLAGAVLLKVIPVLDGAAALLSHGEVQQMLQVVCDSGEELALSGAAAFGDGAGQDGPAAGGATAHKAALVKVALARALARTHLLAASEPGHSPVPSLAMPKQLLTNAPAPPV